MTSLKPHARIARNGHQFKRSEPDYSWFFSDNIEGFTTSLQRKQNKRVSEWIKKDREKRKKL